jgi:hypothetical protein
MRTRRVLLREPTPLEQLPCILTRVHVLARLRCLGEITAQMRAAKNTECIECHEFVRRQRRSCWVGKGENTLRLKVVTQHLGGANEHNRVPSYDRSR